MVWTEIHRPRSFEEVVGNRDACEELWKWALDWQRGKRGRPILLTGPPGVGKTTAAHTLASSMGWEIFEVNASDVFQKNREDTPPEVSSVRGNAWFEQVHRTLTSSNIFGSHTLVIIDELDAANEYNERVLLSLVRDVKQPLVFIAQNPYDKRVYAVKNVAHHIAFKRINYRTIASVLETIARAEGIIVEKDVLLHIAQHSNGDLRSAIVDFETCATGKRTVTKEDLRCIGEKDREKDIFRVLATIYHSPSFQTAVSSPDLLDMDPSLLFRWIERNLGIAFSYPPDLSRAYDSLSRADVFEGRIINRQYYSFRRYSMVLATAGVAVAKSSSSSSGFLTYQRPLFVSHQQRRALLSQIGMKVHCSARKASSYLLTLPQTASFFDLSSEDLKELGVETHGPSSSSSPRTSSKKTTTHAR